MCEMSRLLEYLSLARWYSFDFSLLEGVAGFVGHLGRRIEFWKPPGKFVHHLLDMIHTLFKFFGPPVTSPLALAAHSLMYRVGSVVHCENQGT
jgi:hypothetical protein